MSPPSSAKPMGHDDNDAALSDGDNTWHCHCLQWVIHPHPPYSLSHGFQVPHHWQRHGNQMTNDNGIIIHCWPFSMQQTVSTPSPIHLRWPTNRQQHHNNNDGRRWQHNRQRPSTTPWMANTAQHHPWNSTHKQWQQPNTTPRMANTAQLHPMNQHPQTMTMAPCMATTAH